MAASLLLLTCALRDCSRRFLLCSSCYRGHRYCSATCSRAGRRESVRRARASYACTPKGAARHRDAVQRHYRRRHRQQSLTDHSSRDRVDARKLLATASPSPLERATRTRDVDRFEKPISDQLQVTNATQRPKPRCAWCGRDGSNVLFGRHRFPR